MRKWLIIGVVFLLFPWLTSLVWMRAAGATAEQETVGFAAEVGNRVNTAEKPRELAESEISEAGMTAGTDVVVGEKPGTGSAGTSDSGTATFDSSASDRRILVERQGIRTYMNLEDYLPGVIVCQTEPDFQMEALKCQAVIARTYICRLMEERSEIHEEELDLDYLGELDKGIFQSPQKREQAAAALERCRQAVRETNGLTMQYENRYLLPLFHRMSAGRTRKGEADFPYLQAVESGWDTKREDYLTVTERSMKEFAADISRIPDTGQVQADQLAGQIQIVKKDDSGYVREIKIGARTYSGEEIQYALGLPSSCYSLELAESGNYVTGKKIRITTRGSGHGYGLSQAGADSMAAEGWRCEDILKYYYKNISLISE